MFTLIKREIESILLYLIIPLVFVVVAVSSLIYIVAYNLSEFPPVGIPWIMFSIFWFSMVFLPLISAGIGSAQMYSDRSKRISTYLCTLATSRGRILTARLIAGSCSFLIVLIPLAVTDLILLQVYPRMVPIDSMPLIKLFISPCFFSAKR